MLHELKHWKARPKFVRLIFRFRFISRNLSPAQTEWTLSNQTSLESEEPNLDNYQKTQLQTKNIVELVEKIFDFLTSPNVPRRTK